jgi:hypothetical protein
MEENQKVSRDIIINIGKKKKSEYRLNNDNIANMIGKEWRIFLNKNVSYRSSDIYNGSLFRNSVIVSIINSAFINGFTVYNVEYIIVRKSEIRNIENIKIKNKNL